MGVYDKQELHFGSPHNKDHNVFGFSLAPQFLETLICLTLYLGSLISLKVYSIINRYWALRGAKGRKGLFRLLRLLGRICSPCRSSNLE